MTPAQLHKLDRQLSEHMESITVGMGRTERRRALSGYVTGLLGTGGIQEAGAARACGFRHAGQLLGEEVMMPTPNFY
ncbi:hypothetical protein D7X30_21385 [Corallococcus sp. AB011P]|nr:hypothetical protein D7X30_21385 [Corallococcus sp. AB011P]